MDWLPLAIQADIYSNALDISASQLFLPRGTLGEVFEYLVALLVAKIVLKVNKSDNWQHP